MVDLSLPFEDYWAICEATRKELGITDELLRRAKQARLAAGWATFFAVAIAAYAILQLAGGYAAFLFVITGIGPAIIGTAVHGTTIKVLLPRMAPGVLEYEKEEAERTKAAQEAYERQVKASTEYWTSLTGHEFEEALTDLFCGLGFEATMTNRSGDGGVDITVIGDRGRIAIQCKRYKKPVGVAVIRELYGAAAAGGYKMGVLAVTGGVTKGVREFIENRPLCLLELEHIVRMQMARNAKGPDVQARGEPELTLLCMAGY